jgi:hypothetical protein
MRPLMMTFGVAIAMSLNSAVVAEQKGQFVGPGQFCLKKAAGPSQCQWQTKEQCEQARPAGSPDHCVDRTNGDTVGAGPHTGRRDFRDQGNE